MHPQWVKLLLLCHTAAKAVAVVTLGVAMSLAFNSLSGTRTVLRTSNQLQIAASPGADVHSIGSYTGKDSIGAHPPAVSGVGSALLNPLAVARRNDRLPAPQRCSSADSERRCIAKTDTNQYEIVRCNHVFKQGLDAVCKYFWDDVNARASLGRDAQQRCDVNQTLQYDPAVVCVSLRRVPGVYTAHITPLSRSNVPALHSYPAAPAPSYIMYDRCMNWTTDIASVLCPHECTLYSGLVPFVLVSGVGARPTVGTFVPSVPGTSISTTALSAVFALASSGTTASPNAVPAGHLKICLYSNVTTANNDGVLAIMPVGTHDIVMQAKDGRRCFWVAAESMMWSYYSGFYAGDHASVEGYCA